MYRFALRPRWIVAHLLVLAVVVAFPQLGAWQLRRLDERRTANTVNAARYQAPVTDVSNLLAAAGPDLSSLEYHRVRATGEFDPAHEVLLRGQVHDGAAGYHVLTPLVLADGRAVIVDRGWVPLGAEPPPVKQAPPPGGTTTVEGIVRPSRTRQRFGPTDPPGELQLISRVDLDRLGEQLPYELLPVYLEVVGPSSRRIPVPADPPTFDDEGPHLLYAIQWFSFTLIVVVGYAFLLRSNAVRRRSP